MNKLFLILLISLISIVGYGQIVEVHTTLLRIDGIEKGQLVVDKLLPIAWEYKFVVTDTLDWTTIDIDSITLESSDLLLRVDSLEHICSDLLYRFNEAEKLNLKYNDIIMLGTPETTIEDE